MKFSGRKFFCRMIAIAALVSLSASPTFSNIIYSARLLPDETHLFSVNPDTGSETQVTSNADPDNLKMLNIYPTVSRDGRRVAFASFRVYQDEGLRLWKQWNGDPLYPHEEFYLYFYSYFPTSTYYTRHKSLNWNIFMIDLDRGTEKKISNFLWEEMEPQFMPRGSDLLYVLTAEKSAFVLKGDPSGKSFKQITLKDNQAERPQVSPDGKKMLFQSFRNYNWDLYTVTMKDLPSQRVEERLTATTYIHELHPHWAPDGKSIVFLANRPESKSFFDLCVMDLETGEKRYLTQKENVNPDAVFSPDGQMIAFTVNGKNGKELFTIKTDGTERNKISKTYSAYFPAWSPDGRRVAFLEGPNRNELALYVAGAKGGGAKKLSSLPCALSSIAWF